MENRLRFIRIGSNPFLATLKKLKQMKNIEKSLEYFYRNVLNYIPPINHPIIEQFYRDAKAIHFSELQELYMEGFEDCAESSANEIEKK
jgi:hypothetical protein